MLDDAELAHLSAQHARYASENYKHYETQRDLLVRYKELVAEYAKLKKSYDLSGARKAGNNVEAPFVVVLIDGDTYKFDEDMVRRKLAGGAAAAKLLKDSVHACLVDTPYEDCRVIAYVYCNMLETSKALSRARLVGAEKRSLGPFAAGFSSEGWFNFIDAGEDAASVFVKIGEAAQLFAYCNTCKQVFIGTSNLHDYIDLASGYKGQITLVESAPFDTDWVRDSLNNPDLPRKQSATLATSSHHKNVPESPRLKSKWATSFSPRPISPQNEAAGPRRLRPKEFRERHPSLAQNIASNHARFHSTDDADLSSNFVPCKPPGPNQIPINRQGQRLDAKAPRPSQEAWSAFTARTTGIGTKLCNHFQLQGHCSGGEHCKFDHNPIDDLTLEVVRSLALSIPCPRGPQCRVSNCVNGHLCTRTGCRGQSKLCKLRLWMHGLDPTLDAWVMGTDDPDSNKADAGTEQNENGGSSQTYQSRDGSSRNLVGYDSCTAGGTSENASEHTQTNDEWKLSRRRTSPVNGWGAGESSEGRHDEGGWSRVPVGRFGDRKPNGNTNGSSWGTGTKKPPHHSDRASKDTWRSHTFKDDQSKKSNFSSGWDGAADPKSDPSEVTGPTESAQSTAQEGEYATATATTTTAADTSDWGKNDDLMSFNHQNVEW